MRLIHQPTVGLYLIFEQLEDRIVLDGAVDDVTTRADLVGSHIADAEPLGGTSEDNHTSDTLADHAGTDISSLALESGTEWLQDGTWHYWEQDGNVATGGNGYRFDSWQDGSKSMHLINWDANHNGYEYNLQRNGSWTYQTVQWDYHHNGYSYDATSTGTYHYETHQWANGLGYDYTSDNTGKWTYHTVATGKSSGDTATYMADSTGWSDYTYTWANGQSWHSDNAAAGKETWHVLNPTWSYFYEISTDFGYWKRAGDPLSHFAYHYGTHQWWDRDKVGGWVKLGPAGLSPSFIGDGEWHQVETYFNGQYAWSYLYDAPGNDGYWRNASDFVRFMYEYDSAQWKHYYSGNLHTLGSSGNSAAFIGDGLPHTLFSDGTSYEFHPGKPSDGDFGCWRSWGANSDWDCGINYNSGRWAAAFALGNKWSLGAFRTGLYANPAYYDEVEYKGNHQWVVTQYLYWDANGYQSSTPNNNSYGTDIQYTWVSVRPGSSDSEILAVWYIFNSGADLEWSGGTLSVALEDVLYGAGDPWPMFCGGEQYTKQDVISMEFNLDPSVQGHATLPNILTALGYVKQYYGKTIDNLLVDSHGRTDAFYFGDYISTSNYTSFSTEWVTLNNLMTDNGQLQLAECKVGWSPYMLDDIAARTNTRVFANINATWSHFDKLNSNYNIGDPKLWNHNVKNFFWGDIARYWFEDAYKPKVNFIDQDFEYQSDRSGNRSYTMLFDLYDPEYPQADMVWWWNLGAGRP